MALWPAMMLAAGGYEPAGFVPIPGEVALGAMSAVATDAKSGRVYVLHRGEPPLLAYGKDGRYVKGWGGGMFKVAHGLRVDARGNVWTTDNGNHVLRKFSPDGQLLQTLGEVGVAGGGEKQFRSPDDLVFARNGDIYVADAGNGRIVRLKADGTFVAQWGKKGKGEGEFTLAHGIAIDGKDQLYVADRGARRVQVFAPDGRFLRMITEVGNPFCVLVHRNELLVSEGEIHKIFHTGLDGAARAAWGGPEVLQLPHIMAVAKDGTLYVAEVNGKRVQKFRPR